MKQVMTLSEELVWRGFVHQTTLKDLKELDENKLTFYHGFDASSDSQTIGNLAAMMIDLAFIRHGHKAVILAGGATSLVGDPGGKTDERALKAEEVIAHNVSCAEKQLRKIYGDRPFEMVNNLDWTKDLSLIDFLRTIGKNFSIGDLIKKDFIASRIGVGSSGISYAEFSYTLLQGMDFLHLFDERGVTLQIGGSDQWGNCISGVELIRKVRGKETHVLTHPLVMDKSTGRKFGKSEDGAVWLDSAKTSSFKMYQFWLNVDDDAVSDYIKIYTEIQKEEFDELIFMFNADRAGRSAQKYLAYEVTKLVHGSEAAESVKRISEVLFGGEEASELTAEDFKALSLELPSSDLEDVLEFLVGTDLVKSKGEARRFIEQGAVSINGQKIDDVELKLKSPSLVKRGKHSFAVKI
jgi:tyrosyl-tRNA synthetase